MDNKCPVSLRRAAADVPPSSRVAPPPSRLLLGLCCPGGWREGGGTCHSRRAERTDLRRYKGNQTSSLTRADRSQTLCLLNGTPVPRAPRDMGVFSSRCGSSVWGCGGGSDRSSGRWIQAKSKPRLRCLGAPVRRRAAPHTFPSTLPPASLRCCVFPPAPPPPPPPPLLQTSASLSLAALRAATDFLFFLESLLEEGASNGSASRAHSLTHAPTHPPSCYPVKFLSAPRAVKVGAPDAHGHRGRSSAARGAEDEGEPVALSRSERSPGCRCASDEDESRVLYEETRRDVHRPRSAGCHRAAMRKNALPPPLFHCTPPGSRFTGEDLLLLSTSQKVE